MKKSKLVPLLFVGAIFLPGCGSPAPRNTTGMNPPAVPAAEKPAPFFITCKNCKTINEVAEGGSVCRQCGKPLDMPPATATSNPQRSSGSSGVTSSPRTHSSGGPIFFPSGGGSYTGSRPSSGSPTGPRTYSSGSSTRTPITPSKPSTSSGSSFSSSKPSTSSSSSTSRGGFGTTSRSSIS